MIPHQRIVFVPIIITILVVYTTGAENSSSCSTKCGANKPVKYPFGFSASCPIRLTCDNNSAIRIGEFLVHNITSSSIFVDLPVKCNRSIGSIQQLFRSNYALTRRNSLLLQDCPSQLNDSCLVHTSFVRKRLVNRSCDFKSDNISCFGEGIGETLKFMSYENVNGTNCKFLLSSVAVDADGNASAVSLQFQTVELGWWLEGPLACSAHASPEKFLTPNGTRGFRCWCQDGFRGDGFLEGKGCRKGESTCRDFSLMFSNFRSLFFPWWLA